MSVVEMTCREQVYNFIKEHEELTEISSVIIQEALPWLGLGAVSSALNKFRKEGRLRPIRVEKPVGRQGGKKIIYIREKFFNTKRNFYKSYKLGGTRNRSSGYTVEEDKEISALREAQKNSFGRRELLAQLETLSQKALEIASELEVLRNAVKDKIVM